MSDRKVVKKKKFKSNQMCCVAGCTNRSSDSTKLHRFPKEQEMQTVWKAKLGIRKSVSKYSVVCSNHFAESDYKSSLLMKKNQGQCKLLSFAVPSQNLPKNILQVFIADKEEDQQIELINENNEINENITGPSSPSVTIDIDECIPINTMEMEDYIPNSTILDVITTERLLKSWTGIPTFKFLDVIVNCVLEITSDTENGVLTWKEKILLVFTKLKTNLPFICMSSIFNVNEATISIIFNSSLPIIREVFESAVYFPSVEEIRENLPKSFQPNFVSVRAILDCTEIPIQKPKCTNCHNSTYSHYKGANTVKFLVCVTPAGLISHVSKGYSGNSSDKFIFNSENLLEKFEPHVDSIMVDKEFSIVNETFQNGVKLIRPNISHGKQFQFEKEESEFNSNTSIARVHVDRAIQRIKIFSILSQQIQHTILRNIDDIFFIAAAMTNLSAPI